MLRGNQYRWEESWIAYQHSIAQVYQIMTEWQWHLLLTPPPPTARCHTSDDPLCQPSHVHACVQPAVVGMLPQECSYIHVYISPCSLSKPTIRTSKKERQMLCNHNNMLSLPNQSWHWGDFEVRIFKDEWVIPKLIQKGLHIFTDYMMEFMSRIWFPIPHTGWWHTPTHPQQI